MNSNACTDLERIISGWPRVDRRPEETQIVFSVAGINFCWLTLNTGMVQIRPCLGRKCVTRRLERVGNEVKVIHQNSGRTDAVYRDPGHKLIERFSYPGFMRSQTSLSEALQLIKQAYEMAKGSTKSPDTDTGVASKSRATAYGSKPTFPSKQEFAEVVGIESVYRCEETGLSQFERPGWLSFLKTALQDLPKGVQGQQSNDLLADALARAGVRFEREVKVAPGAMHAVDFLITSDHDKIAVELGTGQAERVELDLLKLINLALLRREVTYTCLILPRDVMRHSVMGRQPMKSAFDGLISMCWPLISLVRGYLKDMIIIWYD